MRPLPPLDSVAFSELLDLCLAAKTDAIWKPNGTFVQQMRNGGTPYWYYKGYEKSIGGRPGRQTLVYLGKVGDPEVDAVVAEHERVNASYKNRRHLTSRLKRAGLPSPHPVEGAIAAVLSEAGLFEAGSTVVGSCAFQTYGGLLGVRLDEQTYRTQDLDVAQPGGLIIDPKKAALTDLLEALQGFDASFTALHHTSEPNLIAGFRNDADFRIEFLTPRRSERHSSDRLSAVAGLAGVGAIQLRFLDFVLTDPVRSVLLHEAGIAIPVPEPARYAVHKLIVSVSRTSTGSIDQNRVKSRKDIHQAQSIIEASAYAQLLPAIGLVWMEAYERGPSWRRTLREGTLRLNARHLELLAQGTREAGALDGFATPFDGEADPRIALLGGTRTPS